jgi:hypothetical protein
MGGGLPVPIGPETKNRRERSIRLIAELTIETMRLRGQRVTVTSVCRMINQNRTALYRYPRVIVQIREATKP